MADKEREYLVKFEVATGDAEKSIKNLVKAINGTMKNLGLKEYKVAVGMDDKAFNDTYKKLEESLKKAGTKGNKGIAYNGLLDYMKEFSKLQKEKEKLEEIASIKKSIGGKVKFGVTVDGFKEAKNELTTLIEAAKKVQSIADTKSVGAKLTSESQLSKLSKILKEAEVAKSRARDSVSKEGYDSLLSIYKKIQQISSWMSKNQYKALGIENSDVLKNLSSLESAADKKLTELKQKWSKAGLSVPVALELSNSSLDRYKASVENKIKSINSDLKLTLTGDATLDKPRIKEANNQKAPFEDIQSDVKNLLDVISKLNKAREELSKVVSNALGTGVVKQDTKKELEDIKKKAEEVSSTPIKADVKTTGVDKATKDLSTLEGQVAELTSMIEKLESALKRAPNKKELSALLNSQESRLPLAVKEFRPAISDKEDADEFSEVADHFKRHVEQLLSDRLSHLSVAIGIDNFKNIDRLEAEAQKLQDAINHTSDQRHVQILEQEYELLTKISGIVKQLTESGLGKDLDNLNKSLLGLIQNKSSNIDAISKDVKSATEQVKKEVSNNIEDKSIGGASLTLNYGFSSEAALKTITTIQEFFNKHPVTVRFSLGERDVNNRKAFENEFYKLTGVDKGFAFTLMTRNLNAAITKAETLKDAIQYFDNHALTKGGKFIKNAFSEKSLKEFENVIGTAKDDKNIKNFGNLLATRQLLTEKLTEEGFQKLRSQLLEKPLEFGITIQSSRLDELKRTIEKYLQQHPVQVPVGFENLNGILSQFEKRFSMLFNRFTGQMPTIAEKVPVKSIAETGKADLEGNKKNEIAKEQQKVLNQVEKAVQSGTLAELVNRRVITNYEALVGALTSLGNAAKVAYEYIGKLKDINFKIGADDQAIISADEKLIKLKTDLETKLVFTPTLNDERVKKFVTDLTEELNKLHNLVKNLFGSAGENIGIDPNSRNKIRVTLDIAEFNEQSKLFEATIDGLLKKLEPLRTPIKLYADAFEDKSAIGDRSKKLFSVIDDFAASYEWLRNEKLKNNPLTLYAVPSDTLTQLLKNLENIKMSVNLKEFRKQIREAKVVFRSYFPKTIAVEIEAVLPHMKILSEIAKIQKQLGVDTNIVSKEDLAIINKLQNMKQVKPIDFGNDYAGKAKLWQQLSEKQVELHNMMTGTYIKSFNMKILPKIEQADIDKELGKIIRTITLFIRPELYDYSSFLADVGVKINVKELKVFPVLHPEYFDKGYWTGFINTHNKLEIEPKLINKKDSDEFIDKIDKKHELKIEVLFPKDLVVGNKDLQNTTTLVENLLGLVTGIGKSGSQRIRNIRISEGEARSRIASVRDDFNSLLKAITDENTNKLKITVGTLDLSSITNQVSNASNTLKSHLDFSNVWQGIQYYLSVIYNILSELNKYTRIKVTVDDSEIQNKILNHQGKKPEIPVTIKIDTQDIDKALQDVINHINSRKKLPTVPVIFKPAKGSKAGINKMIKDFTDGINAITAVHDVTFTTSNLDATQQKIDSLKSSIDSISGKTHTIDISESQTTSGTLQALAHDLGLIEASLKQIHNHSNININGNINGWPPFGGGNPPPNPPFGGGNPPNGNNNNNGNLNGGNGSGSGGGGNPPGSGGNNGSNNQQWETYWKKVKNAILEADKAHQKWKAGQGSEQAYNQAHDLFKQAMKDYLEFNRAMGTMSFSAQISKLTELASKAQVGSKEFLELAAEISRVSQAQKELNRLISTTPVNRGNILSAKDFVHPKDRWSNSTDSSTMTLSGMPSFLGTNLEKLAYTIRFSGRASKGIGSFFEASSQLMVDIQRVIGVAQQRATLLRDKVKSTEATMREIAKEMKVYKGSTESANVARYKALQSEYRELNRFRKQATTEIPKRDAQISKFKGIGNFLLVVGSIGAALGTLEKSIEMPVRALQYFGNIIMNIAYKIYDILKPGMELYKIQQGAMFSMAASMMSNSKINGQAPDKATALGISKQLMERMALDAEMSAFSLEELVRSYQGTLPILLNLGMNAEQAYEINKGVAGVD